MHSSSRNGPGYAPDRERSTNAPATLPRTSTSSDASWTRGPRRAVAANSFAPGRFAFV